jgi:hypothetical protein
MAFSHGKSAIIKVDNSAGALQTITSFVVTSGSDQSVETADTTVMGGTDRDHIVGLKDNGSFSIEGPWDGAASNIHVTLSGILGQTASVSVEYHPAGTASGTPKLTGEASLTKYQVNSDIGDANKYSAEFLWRGAATWGSN